MKQVLEKLYRRRTFGIKLGLHVAEALLKRLGNPERTFAVVHVAGTNGKGSVCALVESVLRSAGLRTGLYTSPHLVRLNERVCAGGRPISDKDLMSLVAEIEGHSQAVTADLAQEPTFFEFMTALGFEYFRRQRVQVAVVETGMGGRLDATNVVMPLVAVITGIGLEHTQYLGPDLESIAREKCGIIKPGRPVVCAPLPEPAMAVVRQTCAERKAPLVIASDKVSVRVASESLRGQTVHVESADVAYGSMKLPLVGAHQTVNLGTAVAAVEAVCEVVGLPLRESALKQGVEAAQWPGRFHILGEEPPVVLDGAHNPAAGEALAESLRRLFKKRPLGLVMGMCADKDVKGFLKPFSKLVKRVWIVPIGNERNMDPGQIKAAAETMGWITAQTSLPQAMSEAVTWATAERGAVCIAGSLFLVGEVLARGAEVDPN